MLELGDRAPAFTLADQHGDKVALTSFKGRKVFVYFYPKADTPGCTTQACGLRDAQPDLGDTVVLGISPDPPADQAAFDAKFALGFPLLSDPEHVVAEKYGVWGDKSMYGRTYQGVIRSAFLIDEKGKVAHAWYKISPKETTEKLRQAASA
ncbi:thioredoxin-dependent thiol peroxidase [soil metagenome]|jgi:peroxiredoxin Q/BCP